MSERSRLLGNNIQLLLFQKDIKTEDFAKAINLDINEVNRLIDARLMISSKEKQSICDFFEIKKESLYIEHTMQEYAAAGCMECRGEFSSKESKNMILDMFDYYCDLKESLVSE